jgi:heme-degrading monooxygenase HmoA
MIARLWSARTRRALAPSYLNHFRRNVQRELRKVDGFAGATVLTRPLPKGVEILVTTFWRSLQAIDAFAGPDREVAVVAPEAAALLTNYDRRVRHYDLAISNLPTGALRAARRGASTSDSLSSM